MNRVINGFFREIKLKSDLLKKQEYKTKYIRIIKVINIFFQFENFFGRDNFSLK